MPFLIKNQYTKRSYQEDNVILQPNIIERTHVGFEDILNSSSDHSKVLM